MYLSDSKPTSRTLMLLGRILVHLGGVGSAAIFIVASIKFAWISLWLWWSVMLVLAGWDKFFTSKLQELDGRSA